MTVCSFIIPVYNCKNDLPACIESIINIGLTDYEIVLVDDGSMDGSSVLCDELVLKYKDVKCIHKKNGGVSSARNLGLELAQGELILFLDADDSIEFELLSAHIKYMQSNDNVDLLMFGMSFDYYCNRRMYRRDALGYQKNGVMERKNWINSIEDLFYSNMISPVWNKIYRKSIITQNKIRFRENMFLYEDLDFSIRYMACCNRLYNTSDVIYHYRQSEDEGNAGRRLFRIPHISDLINQMEMSFDIFVENEDVAVQQTMNNILLQLYLILAQQKIGVSKKKEIRQVCQDFSAWYEKKNVEAKGQVINWLLGEKVYCFMMKRTYSKFRHTLAVKVKNTKWYQRRYNKI